MVSLELLKQLKIILKEEYGKTLNEKQVFEVAENLVGFFEIFTKIESKEKFKNRNNIKKING